MLTIPSPLLVAICRTVGLVDLPGAREVQTMMCLKAPLASFQVRPRGPCLPVRGYWMAFTIVPTVFLTFRVSSSGMCPDSVGSAPSAALTTRGP